jgi:hypothetical protein
MTPKEIVESQLWQLAQHTAETLRYLSHCVQGAQLSDGRRVLDASDFRQFLEELAMEAEKEA